MIDLGEGYFIESLAAAGYCLLKVDPGEVVSIGRFQDLEDAFESFIKMRFEIER